MRNPSDLCLLCNERPANQRNSHVIPKFFGKGIFSETNPRHGVQLDKNGSTKKIQDLVKEDYWLCPECEKGFSILETYCALRIGRFNNNRFLEQFSRYQRGEYDYVECHQIDIRIFNLFIYSIVWRCSISNHYGFQKFKLQIVEEEKLREILKRNITKNEPELLRKLNDLRELPPHSHVIIRPNKILRPPNSMLSGASLQDWMHQLFLVDYMVLYITDHKKLINDLKEIDNNNLTRKVRIGLTNPELWKAYNFDLINKWTKP